MQHSHASEVLHIYLTQRKWRRSIPTAKAYTVRYEAVNATPVEKLIQHPVLMSVFLAVFVSRESAAGG